MIRDINHVFYKFKYPVLTTFTKEKFEEWLTSINTYRLNHDDTSNLECIGVSYLSNFETITSVSFSDNIKKSLFYWRFVKWKYWDQIYLYSKTGNFSDVDDNTDFIWRESDKKEDEMIVKDFYYMFKLSYNKDENIIYWAVSRPTFQEWLSKSELEFVIKNIIENNFTDIDTASWIWTFWLEEILWQQELETLSSSWLTISYVQTKKVWEVLKDLHQNVDWYDESDTVDINVSINKSNTSKLESIIRKFKPYQSQQQVDNFPIKKLVIQNDFWKIINLDEICFKYLAKDIDVIDWTIIWDTRSIYIKNLSIFILEKIFPNI